MPKVDHEDHLGRIGLEISHVTRSNPELLQHRPEPLSIVASIESAQALWRIGEIAQWKSKHGRLSALLVRPNDCPPLLAMAYAHLSLRRRIVRGLSYRASWVIWSNLVICVDCADTRIIRTPFHQELLYTRSKIVAAAKAFGLDAIDMVSCDMTFRARVETEFGGSRSVLITKTWTYWQMSAPMVVGLDLMGRCASRDPDCLIPLTVFRNIASDTSNSSEHHPYHIRPIIIW